MTARWLTRRVLGLFVLPGLFFGVVTGLQYSSARRGFVEGVFFALLFGAFMTVVVASRTRRISGVSRAERRQVMTLVQKGQAGSDPRLAGAVLEYAQIVRRAQGQPQSVTRMTAIFVTLSGVILIAALISGHPAAIAADAVMFAIWAFNVFWLPKQREKILKRTDLAVAQALQVLKAEPATSDHP